MDIQTLLTDDPLIHEGIDATPLSLRLDTDMLYFLDQQLQPGMKTIETGAGVSTILFALKQTRHTCIVPDPQQVDRIQAYCAQRSISLDMITFLIDRSEYALPKMQDSDYDLALIDGGHGFPMPFLDWFYLATLLKEGGICVVDDLHIWTCQVLAQFLCEDPAWKTMHETSRAAVFVKTRAGRIAREWTYQPFVRRHSRATSYRAKIQYLSYLLASGKITLLIANIRAKFAHRRFTKS